MLSYSKLVCGNYCTLCVDNDDFVYVMGQNDDCKLGLEKKIVNIATPTRIPTLSNIKLVCCAFSQTMCLDYEGNVFIFGSNSSRRLGIGVSQSELGFTHLPKKLDVPLSSYISCGTSFFICLTYEGKLYCFGDNTQNQLGSGDKIPINIPTIIHGLDNVEYVECGSNFVYCYTNNQFFCWGSNIYGQLGDNSFNNSSIPKLCNNIPENIISFKCGTNYVLFLTQEGKVYGCGSSSNGELGTTIVKNKLPILFKDIPEIRKISCGNSHTLLIDINDNLWVCGNNYGGQLGLGHENKIYVPTLCSSVSNVIDTSYKGLRTFIKDINGNVYACGGNSKSQLGFKSEKPNILYPTKVFTEVNIWGDSNIKSRAKSARK